MELIVRNSSVIITDYEWNSCPRIENSFRIYDMLTHSYYYTGLYYDEEKKILYLPRGIDIWFLEQTLGMQAKIDHNYDKFELTEKFMVKYLPRDDVQKEALRFMTGEYEYSKNKMRSQLSVNLNTGKGKTYVSIATIAYERKRSIIITYSNGWLEQWKKCILEYTDAEAKDVYQISGSKSIEMILSGKSIHDNHSIYLVTHATIKSFANANGWEKVGELFRVLKIGFKFYDEAHLNFANICMIDFFTNTYRTYYVTATPARSSEEENRIYQLYLKNIPSIELFNKEEDPHTDYIALLFNSNPSPYQVSALRNAYGLDINKYCDYVIDTDNFKMMLHIVLEKVFKMCGNAGKALFFFHTNAAILKIKAWLEENYPELTPHIGVYTSLSENKKLEKEKKIILTTAKSAGAAEDIKGLKVAVIMAEPFKSKVTAKQILGRTRDSDTYLLELIDLGFRKIKQWYYAKLNTYQKYALSTKEALIRQVELEDKTFEIMQYRDPRVTPMFKCTGSKQECVNFCDTGDNKQECVSFINPMVVPE